MRAKPPRATTTRAAAEPDTSRTPTPQRAFLELKAIAAAGREEPLITVVLSFDCGRGEVAAFWIGEDGSLESLVPAGRRFAKPPAALSGSGGLLWLFHKHALAPTCRGFLVGEGVLEFLDRHLPPEEGRRRFVRDTVTQLALGAAQARRPKRP
jgi:hypothetical protein